MCQICASPVGLMGERAAGLTLLLLLLLLPA
jgi:hypothetical protein